MSSGTKKEAVSGEKGSPSQNKSESVDMRIAGLFLIMDERFDEQQRFEEEMDSRFEAFQEHIKNTNQRLEELQLRVQWSRLAGMGIQEGKSGEPEEIAIKARGIIITPPEPQLQQPLLPS